MARITNETIQDEMTTLGFNDNETGFAANFFNHLGAITAHENNNIKITAYLQQQSETKLFQTRESGEINVNLEPFSEFEPHAHIFIQLTLTILEKYHHVTSWSIDWDSIDNALHRISTFEHVTRIHKYLLIFDYCHKKTFNKATPFFSNKPIIDLQNSPQFYTRVGNVELRALRTVIRHPESLDSIVREICDNLHSHDFMYQPNTSDDAQVADLSFSIRQLITNAGMYGTTHANLLTSLYGWANRYLSACFNGSDLLLDWNYGMHAHSVRLAAVEAGLQFRRVRGFRFGNVYDFYNQLAGKTILIVSPFAKACVDSVESGAVKRLWKNLHVPCFKSVGVEARITTHPNRPHGSWLETFLILCERIDKAMDEHEIDLVLGACGCYGLPLLDYCHSKHGVNCVYYGNLIHLFFGIRQNDFARYMTDANPEFWTDPLSMVSEKPFNLHLIDNGRYVGG